MSAHRRHTLDFPANPPVPANPQPIPQYGFTDEDAPGRERRAAIAGLLLCVFIFAGAIAAVLHAGHPTTVQPVRQPQATGCPLAPMASLAAAP